MMVSELYNPLLDWGEGPAPVSLPELPDTLMGTAGAWTEQEDRTLVDALVKHLDGPWRRVAKHLPNRDVSQCRERYHRVLKNSPKYADLIPQQVRDYRRNAQTRKDVKPPPIQTEEDLFAASTAELEFGGITAEDLVQAACETLDETQDRFSFEEIHELGAMPHLTQPVPIDVPSPRTLLAPPKVPWCAPESNTLDNEPAAHTFPKELPPMGKITFRTVAKVHARDFKKSGFRMRSDVAGPKNGFLAINFAQVNKVLNRGATMPSKHFRKKAKQSTGIVFNTGLVRTIS